ncbi:unnamed protein product [Adineta steineri]|uniref:Uncharacterized protein n=1 Tax=Adineta steineri TaxID=433720 RepID=A0A818LZF9_9BILA|nr:unnamed protein product [Adineta steineri]CAF0977517.1 unnamed protein product [Adineta steineri]CAF3582681.1 unnamed protein product [Adineta steineri]CAF3969313.1 unnamed protein product [Adineta steineri]
MVYKDWFPQEENTNTLEESDLDQENSVMDYSCSNISELVSSPSDIPPHIAIPSTTTNNSGFLTPQLPQATKIFHRQNPAVSQSLPKNRNKPIITPTSLLKSLLKSINTDLLSSQEYPYQNC